MPRIAPVRGQLRRPRPSVQVEQDRVADVFGPLEDPLIGPAEAHLFQGGDRLGPFGTFLGLDPDRRRAGRVCGLAVSQTVGGQS